MFIYLQTRWSLLFKLDSLKTISWHYILVQILFTLFKKKLKLPQTFWLIKYAVQIKSHFGTKRHQGTIPKHKNIFICKFCTHLKVRFCCLLLFGFVVCYFCIVLFMQKKARELEAAGERNVGIKYWIIKWITKGKFSKVVFFLLWEWWGSGHATPKYGTLAYRIF